MPVPASYTVVLHRPASAVPETSEHIRIVVEPSDPALPCVHCHRPEHDAQVMVPLSYTPVHGQAAWDPLRIQAILHGARMCVYPLHVACVAPWGMYALRMAPAQAQYIAGKVQRCQELLTHIHTCTRFLRQPPHAHQIMAHRFFPRDILAMVERHLRQQGPSHVCSCLTPVWYRARDALSDQIETVYTQTFGVQSVPD